MASAHMADPFRDRRIETGILDGQVGDDSFVMALRFDDLKRIARNWGTFTSDVPFRVPIPAEHDVRSVRQLPIETDPPAHTAYRQLIAEVFSRRRAAAIAAEVRAVVDALLDTQVGAGPTEMVREFALPVQSRALALLLGRPPSDADLWTSWGTHVFRDFADGEAGHASDLDAYLGVALEQARAEPGDDFFGVLARAIFDGRHLSDDELMGFANLVFAGGRDTVIGVIVDSLHHLATTADALGRLRSSPGLRATAIEEYLRHSSPITHIGRIVAEPVELCGRSLDPGDLVSLCFASANRDEEVFDEPDRIMLDRQPNRHVAFGHGPHTCIGAPHTRMVLDAVLAAVATRVERMELIGATEKVERLGPVQRRSTFDTLVLDLVPRH